MVFSTGSEAAAAWPASTCTQGSECDAVTMSRERDIDSAWLARSHVPAPLLQEEVTRGLCRAARSSVLPCIKCRQKRSVTELRAVGKLCHGVLASG
jgi:hypothetical protein